MCALFQKRMFFQWLDGTPPISCQHSAPDNTLQNRASWHSPSLDSILIAQKKMMSPHHIIWRADKSHVNQLQCARCTTLSFGRGRRIRCGSPGPLQHIEKGEIGAHDWWRKEKAHPERSTILSDKSRKSSMVMPPLFKAWWGHYNHFWVQLHWFWFFCTPNFNPHLRCMHHFQMTGPHVCWHPMTLFDEDDPGLLHQAHAWLSLCLGLAPKHRNLHSFPILVLLDLSPMFGCNLGREFFWKSCACEMMPKLNHQVRRKCNNANKMLTTNIQQCTM